MLCIGGGGGSLPLFLAETLPDAQVSTAHHIADLHMTRQCVSQVDVVELDPEVIRAMPHCGFHAAPPRLRLHAADGAAFVAAAAASGAPPYDLAVIDAFDGNDCVPATLTQPPFLRNLAAVLHPSRGAALMNVHGGLRPDALASALAAAEASAQRALRVSAQPSVRERGFDAATPAGAAAAAASAALGSVGGAAFTLSVSHQDNVICAAAHGVPPAALPSALAAAAAQAGVDADVPFDCGARAVRGLSPAAQPQQQRDWSGGGMSPA